MAFTPSNLRTVSSAGPAASLVGATVSAAIGDVVVVNVAAANSGTSGAAVTTTCTDTAGNTYTQRTQVNNTAGVADDGITLTTFTSKLTSTLSNGDITVSFSPSSAQGCAFTAIRYRPALGEVAFFIEAGVGATGNSTSPSITAPSVGSLDLIIGCIAEEAGTSITEDGDTTDGTWSTKYELSIGSGATAAHILSQSKAVSATGAQTFNPTTAAAHDFAINYIILRSYTINQVLALPGSYAVSGTAATLNVHVFNEIIVANAGSYSVSGQAATLTKAVKTPLWPNSVASNPLDYIHTTDPDQFERLEYLGLLVFDIYSDVSGESAHVFRVHFRDMKVTVATLAASPFATTNTSAVVRVTHTAHGYRTGARVVYSGTSSVGGIQVQGGATHVYVLTYVSDNTYDITHTSAATSTATGGGTPTATYNQFRIALDATYSYAEAKAQALLLAARLGKLPLLYRSNIKLVIVHPGDDNLTSEDAGHYFVIYADRMATRISNNDFEESCLHEGTHAAIQKATLGIGVAHIDDPAWDTAIAADNAYITEYAATADQEDFAESALFAYTHLLHPERLEPYLAAIEAQIPNRLAWFQDVVFAGQHTACARVSASSVASKLPAGFISSLVDNTALASHCRDIANLKVEAFYSHGSLAAAGVPDLYKFTCNVCGRVHPRSSIGSEPRPFWNVR